MKMIFTFLMSLIVTVAAHAELPADLKNVQTGDIIFQNSGSQQSMFILAASNSLNLSHVGIIEVNGNRREVIEAVSPVKRTDLEEWINRPKVAKGEYAVYRYRGLEPEKAKELVKFAWNTYKYRPYDLAFNMEDDRKMYCSELVYNAFEHVGRPIGKKQKIGSLYRQDLVEKLIRMRHDEHPLCRGRSVDQCVELVKQTDIITPKGLIDWNLTKVADSFGTLSTARRTWNLLMRKK